MSGFKTFSLTFSSDIIYLWSVYDPSIFSFFLGPIATMYVWVAIRRLILRTAINRHYQSPLFEIYCVELCCSDLYIMTEKHRILLWNRTTTHITLSDRLVNTVTEHDVLFCVSVILKVAGGQLFCSIVK